MRKLFFPPPIILPTEVIPLPCNRNRLLPLYTSAATRLARSAENCERKRQRASDFAVVYDCFYDACRRRRPPIRARNEKKSSAFSVPFPPPPRSLRVRPRSSSVKSAELFFPLRLRTGRTITGRASARARARLL